MDIETHFNLIFSVAKFYEVKTIILLNLTYSDSLFVPNLIKTSPFYLSVIDSHQFKEMKLGHERTMAVCYGYNVAGCGCLQNLQPLIDRFPRVIWFVMCSHSSDNFQSLYIPFNYQFIIAQEHLGKNEFLLMEVYKVSPGSKLYSSDLGSWKRPNVLTLTEDSFFQRRSNFWKEEVRIVPHVTDRSGDGSSAVLEYEPGLWWSMERRLNATSQAVSKSSNFDINIHVDHAQEYQALPVMLTIKSRLYYKAVTGESSLSQFFHPFNRDVWLFIVGFILISSVGMTFVNKSTIFSNEHFSSFLLDALYIFLQQGSQIKDNRSGFFIIKALQLLLSLLIYLLYGCILISFITAVVSKPPFTNLEGILENGRYNILAIEGRGRVIFEQSPGIVKELYLKHVNPVEDSPKSFVQSFHRVCFGGTKLLTECGTKLVSKFVSVLPGHCRVDSVPFTTIKRTFIVPKGNQFEEVFRVCITKLLESEAAGNIFWSKALGLEKPDREGDFESITFSEISSLFLIFVVGIISSLIILVIELTRKI